MLKLKIFTNGKQYVFYGYSVNKPPENTEFVYFHLL